MNDDFTDSVAYAIADSPFGPFDRVAKILQEDKNVATGAGHHSVMHAPGKMTFDGVERTLIK